MRVRLAAAVVALALLSGSAIAQNTVERVTIKGAQDIIIMPKDWNGSLFLYAHGYTADKRILEPIPEDLGKANTLLLPGLLFVPPGYASAVTTFRSVGWYVKDAVKDVENLRRYFVKKHGKPKHTYIWGHSGGGMVTEAVIEYFPRTYEGAAPMCGTGAGARRNFNGALDLRVLYEYACQDVPAARFVCRVCSDGKSRCLKDADCPAGQTCGAAETPAAPEDGLTPECTGFLLDHPETFSENPTAPGGDFVTVPLTACFGDLSPGGVPSAEQAARKDVFLRASRIPQSFVPTDMFFASIGMAEVVHRRTHGRHPWGNVGVDYAPPRNEIRVMTDTMGNKAVAMGGICEFSASQGLPITEDGFIYTLFLPAPFGIRSGSRLKNALRDQALGQHLFGLTMQAEDAPQRTNFVDLDPRYTDVYGVPVARITYQNHPYELMTRQFYVPYLKQVVVNAGAAPDKVFVTPVNYDLVGPPSSRHIMGTLRMGNDPATSVTRPDGRFHDVDNLYACDGSVFPTSSGYNPTLTIIAVALKIAHGIAGTPPSV